MKSTSGVKPTANRNSRGDVLLPYDRMTGALDFLTDAVAKDLDAYAEFTTKRLIGWPGVKEIRSSFVLQEAGGQKVLPRPEIAKNVQDH